MQVNLHGLPAASFKEGPDRSEILYLQNPGMILDRCSKMTVVVSPKYNFVYFVTVKTVRIIYMQFNTSFVIAATLNVHEKQQ